MITRTQEGQRLTTKYVVDHIELKPEKEHNVSLRVAGHEVAKINASKSLSFMRDNGHKDNVKLQAISHLLKEGSDNQISTLLSLLKLDELVEALLSYNDLKAIREPLQDEFDSPVANTLLYLQTLSEQVVKPLGLELEVDNVDLGITMKISLVQRRGSKASTTLNK